LADSFDSDSDEEDEDKEEDEDEDLLPIEKASKKDERRMKRDEKLNQKEIELNFQKKETFVLPSGQELEREATQAPDLQVSVKLLK